jgi:hypothetical protein
MLLAARRRSLCVGSLLVLLTGACDKQASPPSSSSPPGQPQACTEEAKICPDGSAVGRTGPNCEFAPCPDAGAEGGAPPSDAGEGGAPPPGGGGVACTMDAKICPDGSAVGRTAPNCEFAPCPK